MNILEEEAAVAGLRTYWSIAHKHSDSDSQGKLDPRPESRVVALAVPSISPHSLSAYSSLFSQILFGCE